jgi:hypothetical protein
MIKKKGSPSEFSSIEKLKKKVKISAFLDTN